MERNSYQYFQFESKDVVRNQAYNCLFFSPYFHDSLNIIQDFQTNQGIVGNREGFGIYGGKQLERIEAYLQDLCEQSGYYPIVSINVQKYIHYLQDLIYSESLSMSDFQKVAEQKIQFLKRMLLLDKHNQGNYHERFCNRQLYKYSKGFFDMISRYANFQKESNYLSCLAMDFTYTKCLLELSGDILDFSDQDSNQRNRMLKSKLFFDPKFLDYCRKLLKENSPLLQEPVIIETISYVLNANQSCLTNQPMMSYQKLRDNLDEFQKENQYLRTKIPPFEFENRNPQRNH